VVGRRDGPLRVADPQAARPKPGERLGRGDLVNEVKIDGKDGRRSLVLADDVVVPDLLDDRAWFGHEAALRDTTRAGRAEG
jgi:hypothetical protein